MYNNEFEKCWKIYPRRIGKLAAYKSYMKALKRGGTDEIIIRGINDFAEYTKINRTEQKYIPHLCTWLNNDRWDDNLTEERANQRRQSDTGLSMVAAIEIVSQNQPQSSLERCGNVNGDEDVFYISPT